MTTACTYHGFFIRDGSIGTLATINEEFLGIRVLSSVYTEIKSKDMVRNQNAILQRSAVSNSHLFPFTFFNINRTTHTDSHLLLSLHW